MLGAVERFFKSVRPTVTMDDGGGATLSFSPDERNAEATLNGVFDYIASKERRVAIAIDEFQQILEYPEKGTEALLRSRIQFVENANFIFAGSRHHIMGEMFASPRHPFYQSTDIVSLGVIEKEKYRVFAHSFFAADGRGFSDAAFDAMYDRFDGVTWYLQSVLNRIWGERGSLSGDGAVSVTIKKIGTFDASIE